MLPKTTLLLAVTYGLCFTPLPLYADDETRDKAIGLGIGLLLKGIETLSDTPETTQPHVNNNSSESTSGVISNLRHSNEIAEIQSNLQELGYYSGAIDGLNGQNTTNAINSWRRDNESDRTGNLDWVEKDVLKDQATTSRENHKSEQKNQTSTSGNPVPKTELYDAYYAVTSNKKLYEVCKTFKDSSHELSYMIDPQLERIQALSEKRLSLEIEKIKECNGITDDNAVAIKNRAEKDLNESRIGKMLNLAPHVYVDEQDIYSRIEGCNRHVKKMKGLYIHTKNKPITCAIFK